MMTDDPDSYSQAEIVRLLKGLSSDLGSLRSEVHALGSTFVNRSELDAWRTGYDREVVQIREQIEELKRETAPVKTSGWAVAAVIVSALVGVGSMLAVAITLINVVR